MIALVLHVLKLLLITVHLIVFIPLLKFVTLLLVKLMLLAGILPKPDVTVHAPVLPTNGTACKLIVLVHIV